MTRRDERQWQLERLRSGLLRQLQLLTRLEKSLPEPSAETERMAADCSVEEAAYVASVQVLNVAVDAVAAAVAVQSVAEGYAFAAYLVWQECQNQ